MIYTSDDLIEAIKRNAGMPTSQRKFSPSDFLAFLNEELNLTVVSRLISLQQDYFIESETTALLASTSEYDFPSRAIGWKIEAVYYVDSSSALTKLPRIIRTNQGAYSNYQTSESPTAFYVEGTKLKLVPDVSASPSGSLKVDFIRIQNELVKTTSCGLISTVAVVVNDYQMTVNATPSTSLGVDVISGTNPFNIIARASTATTGVGTVSCATADFERAPVAGDWVCATGTTPIANIPEDFHPVLAQAATIRCLITSNDAKGIQTAQMSLASMINSMMDRGKDRVEGSPQKLVPSNRILNLMR
jgi:hypothetical protein